MPTVQEAAIVSQAVDAPADVVYALARQMDKLPLWAAGLAKGITQRDGEWFAEIYQRLRAGKGVHLRRLHYALAQQDPPVMMPAGDPAAPGIARAAKPYVDTHR